MSEQPAPHDAHDWDQLSPAQVIAAVVYELYHPVSILSSDLNRITADDDPLTEEEYEDIFEQMQEAVRQLSKTVVNLKRYTQKNPHVPSVEVDE
jgi:polyphosphate kinase